ncbi:integrase-like protein [Lactococcus lactis subsp. lactis]|uniref:Integrase n=2 Tax=Lactococcus lactis TaxID=1358 RepID=A0A2A5SJI0_LACLH|nr:site-specific integrase [Lactococcus lactis]KAA8705002.1 site-specific integrase [Lactococcus lactis subsp. hordniae]KSU06155.1 integrase-like protein [Lactococcus lactis subsp. lactis]MCT3134228.1 site-specific integrase [Lactococcus lactis]PCS13632.1 integrase [Lactococcus lactis subsp. hordniae]
MFYKKLESGKYRFFEKFYDKKAEKWRQVTVTLNSKSRASHSEARTRLNEKIEKIESAYLLDESNKITERVFTVQEIYDEWRSIRNEEIKPSSVISEEKGFVKFLRLFSNREITSIRGKDIQDLLMKTKLTSSTRILRRTYYNLFFKYACTVGYIKDNPMNNVVLPKNVKTLSSIQKKQNKFLDKYEMKQILKISYGDGRYFRRTMVYEFLFLTGLRIGELLALQWKDIDFENNLLSVRHTLNIQGIQGRKRELLSPKTINSYRTISINDRCVEILKEFKTDLKDVDFVYVDDRGRTFSRITLVGYFQKICSNLENKNSRSFTLHMLRHSHISLLVELGVPIKTIMQRVGHSDEKMILQVYSHVTEKMETDLIEKLNNFVL